MNLSLYPNGNGVDRIEKLEKSEKEDWESMKRLKERERKKMKDWKRRENRFLGERKCVTTFWYFSQD